MTPLLSRFVNLLRPHARTLFSLLPILGLLTLSLGAAETKSFNVPVGPAEKTLPQFIAQSGLQVAFPTDAVKGVTTRAVTGPLEPAAALEKLLAGTGLVAEADARPGAYAIRRDSIPNAPRAAAAPSPARPETRPAPAREETVELSPFEVKADASETYQATNTNSLAGINTALSKIPVTAEILNRTFLDDLGADNLNRVLGDFMGLGSPVISANELGRGGLDGDDFSSAGLRSRGLAASAARNSLGLGEIAGLDGFSVDRVEVIRGPQSLLYGPGEPGGVINYVSKQANFSRVTASFKTAVDSEGSLRGETDVNAGNGRFAVRVNGLLEDHRTWRFNVGRRQEGALVSLALRPAKGLTLRADYQRLLAVNINAAINYGTSYRTAAGAPADPRAQNLTLLVARGTADGLANGILNFSTVDSIYGNGNFRSRDAESFSTMAEWVATSWLSVQLRYGHDELTSTLGLASTNSGLRGPTDPANLAAGRWAVGLEPGRRQIVNEVDTARALVSVRFPVGRVVKNTLTLGSDRQKSSVASEDRRYYRTDAGGVIVRDPAQLTGTTAGRTVFPVQWIPIDGANFDGPFDRKQIVLTGADGFNYRLAPVQLEGVAVPTSANPRGVNGGTPSSIARTVIEPTSAQAVLMSDWFDGRFDTLFGIRANRYHRTGYYTGEDRSFSGATKNYGLLWHFRKDASLYYGYSDSNNLPSNSNPTFFGVFPGLSRGEAEEIGLKFDLFEGRVSGSVARYTGQQKNATGSQPFREILDPIGINGRISSNNAATVFDVKARGVEVALTAQPVKGLNVRFSYSRQDGETGTTIILPRRYNDEFNTTTVGGVSVVAVNTGGVLTPLDPPGAATTLPVANLTDPLSAQRAVLDVNSGLITNAAALGLTTPGVGTGRIGLPISAHQLGWIPPGGETITVLQAGEKTVGYPEQSFALASSYRIQSGKLKGLTFGMNGSYQPTFRQFFVTDPTRGRYPYYRSDLLNTGGFVGYEIKFGRKLRLKSQLNVANLFDTQKVDIRPNSQTGAANVAAVMYSPRLLTWSNTVSF